MTNNEYQALGMTFYMLREYQEQRKQQETASTEPPIEIEYQHFQDEVLTYPIFANHTCGNQDGKELLAAGNETGFCQRWRFFYSPNPTQLPQVDYQQQKEKELEALQQRLRFLNSPRLILFASTFLMIIFLVMRGHFLLPAIPIIALGWYWYRSEIQIQQIQQQLHQHHQELHGLASQGEKMAHQLNSLPPPAKPEQLHQEYQQAVEHLLRETLLDVLAPYELGDLSQTLRTHQWEGFITESWAYLQLPLAAQTGSAINHLLLNDEHIKFSAMQDDPFGRKGHTLFRMQYLQVWVMTQRGLLMGQGYFDRVANRFLFEQHEFYPYTQLSHIHLTEQPVPEQLLLKERLPENIYQRFFQQAVSILSVKTTGGKTYEYASLPVSERPFRQTEWKDRFGLDADMQRLNRRLHERVYGKAMMAS